MTKPTKAKLKKGSTFQFDGDTWEIMQVGPATTLVAKVGTPLVLNVETYKIRVAIEQHNEAKAKK